MAKLEIVTYLSFSLTKSYYVLAYYSHAMPRLVAIVSKPFIASFNSNIRHLQERSKLFHVQPCQSEWP